MTILLVDDSEDVGILVKRSLNPYSVDQAKSLSEAESLLGSRNYQLIIIDVNLPDGSGFSFCDRLTKNEKYDLIPKIFLTGRNETAEKVYALNSGADDYVTKPFEPAELKARVDSRLRNQRMQVVTRKNGFEIDPDFQRCTFNDNGMKIDFQFTPTEFRIFLALLRADGRPLSRAEIVRAVWKSNGATIEERGVDAHIAHLRKKMGEIGNRVVSVYGKGYALLAIAKPEKLAG